jgi:hypothetical protein
MVRSSLALSCVLVTAGSALAQSSPADNPPISNAPDWLVSGVQGTSVPFDGGTVLVLNAFTVLLPGVAPSGSLPLVFDLPADPTFCGLSVYMQAVYVDPAASGNKHTAQTAGLHWVLGS